MDLTRYEARKMTGETDSTAKSISSSRLGGFRGQQPAGLAIALDRDEETVAKVAQTFGRQLNSLPNDFQADFAMKMSNIAH